MRFLDRLQAKLGQKSLKPFPVALCAGFGVLILTHLSGGVIYFLLKKAYEEEIYEGLKTTSIAIAEGIAGDQYELLNDASQENGMLYNSLLKPLSNTLLNNNEHITYVYTLKLKNDSLFFVLDATPAGDADHDGVDDKAHLMEYYPTGTSNMKVPFKTNKVFVEKNEVCDKWGCFISAYSPIHNEKNQVVGVVGVDISLSKYKEKIALVQKMGALISFFSFVISVAIAFIVGFALVFIRKMIAESKRLSDLKSEFMAVMSHEIRTPMNGILGISQSLDEYIPTDEGKGLLRTIQDSGHGLLQIINDILDFSKIESGKMTLDEQPTSLKLLIGDVHRVFGTSLQTKGIQFESLIADDIPLFVMVDPLRLRQVLMNLIGNAIKFTPTQGQISLKVLLVEGNLNFELKDSGIGISKEAIGQLFQPFVQATSGTARKFGGTGLGLVISRNLVELMGGRIRCESELGKGSQFIWSIPLKNGENKQIISEKSWGEQEEFLWPNHKVLVVDDNEVNLKVAKLLLKKYQVEVDLCSSGWDAIEKVKNINYDLIFLDIQMPDLDGPSTLGKIKEAIPEFKTPISALTANVLAEDRVKYAQMGMEFFLAKPILKKDLANLLIQVFDQKK